MPAVSTTTRSKPATLHAAIASPSAAETSLPVSRVASERMNTFGVLIAFMRMRSPSSAPPVFRRDGSTASTAMFSRSPWSSRKRRTSSSVSELFPAPPVPVMPSVGIERSSASFSTWSRSLPAAPLSSAVISRASARRSPAFTAFRSFGAYVERSSSHRLIMSLIMPWRPIFWPSSGE